MVSCRFYTLCGFVLIARYKKLEKRALVCQILSETGTTAGSLNKLLLFKAGYPNSEPHFDSLNRPKQRFSNSVLVSISVTQWSNISRMTSRKYCKMKSIAFMLNLFQTDNFTGTSYLHAETRIFVYEMEI